VNFHGVLVRHSFVTKILEFNQGGVKPVPFRVLISGAQRHGVPATSIRIDLRIGTASTVVRT
jgi:hypothetical protein